MKPAKKKGIKTFTKLNAINLINSKSILSKRELVLCSLNPVENAVKKISNTRLEKQPSHIET